MEDKVKKKVLICSLTLVLTAIYLIWRITFTLPCNKDGYISIILGIILFLCEINRFVNIIIIIAGNATKITPKKGKINKDRYPDIDVLITCSDEDKSMIYKTINGCINMDYPCKNKVHIYLCDDSNRVELKDLANKFNINYINGNWNTFNKDICLNNMLKVIKVKSPYVAVFKANMIPLHNFLMEMIPYFFDDKGKEKKVGFIQAPQDYYNTDLFQYNLFSEKRVPNEGLFFNKKIQIFNNKINSTVCLGTNVIYSRNALDDTKGFYEDVIAEDLLQGILIEENGYECYAVNKTLAIGLAPSNLNEFFADRNRLFRGVINASKRLKLIFRKKLNFSQKVSYLFLLNYYIIPIFSFIYLSTSLLYPLFNIYIFKCSLEEAVVFFLPQYLLYKLFVSIISDNTRSVRLNGIYNTILFPHTIKSLICEIFNIKIKAKSKRSNNKIIREITKNSIVHVVFLILSIYAFSIEISRYINTKDSYNLVILFWIGINIYYLIMSLFFMNKRVSHRSSERFLAELSIEISFNNISFENKIYDISEGGFSTILDYPRYLPSDEEFNIKIYGERYIAKLKAELVHVKELDERWKYAFKFIKVTEEENRKLLSIIYDRCPSLPETVQYENNMIEDIQQNLVNRIRNKRTYYRKTPRIKLNNLIETIDRKQLKIRDFNYKYILVEEIDTLSENIALELSNKITLNCTLDRVYNNRYLINKTGTFKLYKINNYKDIIYSDEFKSILEDWIIEYNYYDDAPKFADNIL